MVNSDNDNGLFDVKENTLLILDDLMSSVDDKIVDIFTKKSHHSNISIIFVTQNIFNKNKYIRTISLKSNYIIV